MRLSSDISALASVTLLALSALAQQTDPALTGTWTTKSRKVITGPGFYDPVNDKFFEPQLTGQSYSFTSDGHYEVAYYRAISNPAQPNCPQGIMQWQHGTYTTNANGSLILEPWAVDGRQLLSSPCEHKNAIYTRYHQRELIKHYRTYIDTYNNVKRLDLFQYDGAPQNPMWIAYDPPQMLPTVTLNPTSTGTAAAKSTGTAKSKRSLEGGDTSEAQLPWDVPKPTMSGRPMEDTMWWMIALGTVISSVLYLRS
ncbi:MAG: Reversal of tor2 lethality [Heterodermia speciosa]|uniref:Protein ROT1 n=1 Tax=Heterodermia speciosa TaxID=116794 RepID=A0A8H3IAL7_9LECA|nr:MAG: Reversal of tor2 lethality [Heterodermia speciosa]